MKQVLIVGIVGLLSLVSSTKAFAENAEDEAALEKSLAMAKCKASTGDVKSAAGIYEQALTAAGKSFGTASAQYSNVCILLGELELKRHDLAAAEKAFNRALGIVPYHPSRVRIKDLFNDLAALYDLQGKTVQANSLRTQASSIDAQGLPNAGNGPGGIIVADRYPEIVQRRIIKNWFPPKDHELAPIEVSFTIRRNGELSELHLKAPDRFVPANDAALKAIEAAAPFPPLPPGAGETLEMGFNFVNGLNLKRYYERHK